VTILSKLKGDSFMKVIVFGGTGWVGHRIALAFANNGYDLTICSRSLKKEFTSNVADIDMIQADKNNPDEIKQIFEAQKYDIVIDSVPSQVTIEAIYKYARGMKHYIHCSSTGGYAPLQFIPGDETSYYEGFASGWKNTKKLVDNMVLDMFNREGFPATVIRPCYITGPGMLPLDNLGGRREGFIADIINDIELDLPNSGNTLLQPIHADDLAYSFLLAAEAPNLSKGQVYNICLEKAVTHNRYLEITAAVFDKKPKINYMTPENILQKYAGNIHEIGLKFFVEHMCFDISKAKKQLGFVPAYTTEEAIEETAWWAAENLKLR
jgi:nucleoside-diphosphate-sugar epimerase